MSEFDEKGGGRTLAFGREGKNNEEMAISQDFVTKAIKVIRTDHAYIHQGIGFGAEFADLNLPNAGTVNIEFVTPADGYVHFKNVKTVDCIVRVYEKPDSIDRTAATQITPINQNRVAEIVEGKTSGVELYYGVTPTLGSAKLVKVFQEGAVSDTWELDLLQSTSYIIEITNIAGAQNNTFFEAFWYEEPEVYSG